MTLYQRARLRSILERHFHPGAEFHHGDCINSDEQAAAIAKSIGFKIIAHPGYDDSGDSPKRAYFKGNDIVLDAKPYRKRNEDIVKASRFLCAAPRQFKPVRRSGTWTTIRIAETLHVKRIIIYPAARNPVAG